MWDKLKMAMTEDEKKKLAADTDGLICYEYLANNIETCEDDLNDIIGMLVQSDLKGQFSASAARYLSAIDRERYAVQIDKLVNAAIELDREHAYLPSLMQGLYGEDYLDHAEQLSANDDNFRRMYKRLYPSAASL